LWRAAVHEAAHAVVGRLLGASASPKVFDSGDGVTEFRHCLPREWMAVVTVSGPLGEVAFGTVGLHLNLPRPADIAAWTEHQIETDFSDMSPSDAADLRDTPAASIREAVKIAEIFLQNHRGEIVRLAQGLFAKPRNKAAEAAADARRKAREEKAAAAVRARWGGGDPTRFDQVVAHETLGALPRARLLRDQFAGMSESQAARALVMRAFADQVQELALNMPP
jgi:hypothetical protein